MENISLANVMSVKGFIQSKQPMSNSELNWEVKDYLNKCVDLLEKSISEQVDNAKEEKQITSDEWLQAHEVLNNVWYQLRKIIAEMWFADELLAYNAEELFFKRAGNLDKYFQSINSIKLRNILC